MARAIENAGHDLVDRHALGLGKRVQIFSRRCIEIDDAFGIARADGDLVHVHVGRVEQAALLGDREHRQRVRHRLRADGRAFERIDRDIDFGALAGADLLADVEHRRLVHLAFADDDGAPDFDAAKFAAHGIDGGLVGCLLVATATQVGRRDGGSFGHARELEHQNSIESRPVSAVRLLSSAHNRCPSKRGA